jgi:Uma2 family endonuclease
LPCRRSCSTHRPPSWRRSSSGAGARGQTVTTRCGRECCTRGYKPQWNETAALVVEIVSPDDKSWEKLPFYAAHHVDEVVIVDPVKRSVDWLARAGEGYEPSARSGLIEFGPDQLAEQLDWPTR